MKTLSDRTGKDVRIMLPPAVRPALPISDPSEHSVLLLGALRKTAEAQVNIDTHMWVELPSLRHG